MFYEVNECCGCAVPAYPCLGDACHLRHTPKYICDWCGTDELDPDEIEDVDGDDVCLECIAKMEENEDE